MKNALRFGSVLALAILSIGASNSAMAGDDPIWVSCESDAAQGPGTSYQVKFLVGSEVYARLEQVTMAPKGDRVDTRTLADRLPCKIANPSNDHPDLPQTLMNCMDPTSVDSGYNVTYTTPDFTGRHWSVVSQETIAGAKVLAKLVCKQQMPLR